ncbi:PIR Superfamily Protein [Plasmodium ovale curtisi]|uniref:PIR Superfamily Protein n=1 Tax=Plasmodium ovale curtisi TaxID=864141 RepID=A0A1A8WMG0_PLAOA|nr:PIR Superfamily Protein [Plasmodium ovale curtisi]SBT00375.1 PIR Superfamily Protein [Plasmodium ovale curtisi]
MPEDNAKFDLAFYNKLTEDSLNTNKDLKEYYDKIECIYNRNSICLSGKEAEVTDCEETEAIEDDQCSEPDKSPYNDQTNINFMSKFPNALAHFFTYYESSLLQHDHNKQCVYFKYWFYDKIIKNIFSNEKLEEFYEEIKEGDKEDESESEDVEQIRDEKELEEEYLEREEEEEEELVDGRLIDSEEDNTAVCESHHGCKGENLDSKKILFSLDNSSICNIYKLNLDKIKYIKLLYDYLEGYKSKNKNSVEEEISKSTYCSSFNETIELYKEKSKCKIDYLDNEYCQEVDECRNNYSHVKISTLNCNTDKYASDPTQHSNDVKKLQEGPAQSLPGRGTGSSLSSGLVDTKPEGFRESLDSTKLVSTVLNSGDNMKERQPLVDGEHITDHDNLNTQILPSDIMRRSHLMGTEESNTCDNGKLGRSCESSSQPLAQMSTETGNHLNKLSQEKTDMHTEPDVSLQEENGNTNTIVSSASAVLGVSALAFMLYKFTPLGSLINNRRGGMNTWDINEEVYDENLLFSTALGNTNSNNNNYSIGYHSLGNT